MGSLKAGDADIRLSSSSRWRAPNGNTLSPSSRWLAPRCGNIAKLNVTARVIIPPCFGYTFEGYNPEDHCSLREALRSLARSPRT
jgi:hypothetical protein